MAALDGLYDHITDNYVIDLVDLKMVNIEQAFQDGVQASFKEWENLIAKLLKNEIDVIFEERPIEVTDIKKVLKALQVMYPGCFEETDGSKTPTQTTQGTQNTCFAHAAANMILHNVYKFRIDERDISKFKENNCNHYLDTSKPLPEYTTIETECGESGAKRILLFHYIYRVITSRFGYDSGSLALSILYYLRELFHPEFFPDLNHIIEPVFESEDLDYYSLSLLSMGEFHMRDYDPYFEEYYASIYVLEPKHFFTIVGITPTIQGKDSSTGKSFTIPKREFNSTGTVVIDSSIWRNIPIIFLLFKTSKLPSYPKIVEEAILTGDLVPRDTRSAEEANAQGAEKKEQGGKKSRKRKKTRRKRSRKRKN